jgi:hypothetical protein
MLEFVAAQCPVDLCEAFLSWIVEASDLVLAARSTRRAY